MERRLIKTSTLLAGLLLAAACSAKVAQTPAKTQAPPGILAASSTPSAKPAEPPDCSKVEAKDDGENGWRHPDCLMHDAKSGLDFFAHYGPAEARKDGGKETPVYVSVSPEGSPILQTMTEKMGNTFAAPSLQDLDGDGFPELLIPLETGNVNTNFAIWYSPPGANRFVRLGEVSAVNFGKAADGLIAASSRSSANSWSVEFLQLKDAALTPIATVDVTAEGDPDHIMGVKCEVSEAKGAKALKLERKAVKARFCADPAVKDVFK